MEVTPIRPTIHIQTGSKVEFKFTIPEYETQYPSSWFESNRGKKPPIRIPICTIQYEQLVQTVGGGISSAELTLNTAKAFLYAFFSKTTNRLVEDWISFGTIIGHNGADISPWALLEVVEGEVWIPTETMITAGNLKDKERGYAFIILATYRVNKGLQDNYYQELIKKIGLQIKAEGGPGEALGKLAAATTSWMKDPDFLRMIAAIDMYFYRFKSDPLAILRMATLGSRYRDCSCLVSFGFAMKFLTISSSDLIDWTFIKTAGEEIIRLTREGQEVDKPHSYFPYQSDLRLVEKSAYSSVANPYVFHWIHILGSLLGHKRSINARFNFDGNLSDVGLNAIVMLWAFGRGSGLVPQFNPEGRDHFKTNEMEEDEELEGGDDTNAGDWHTAQGRHPETWYALLKINNFTVPHSVKKLVTEQRGKIRDVREGTVGTVGIRENTR